MPTAGYDFILEISGSVIKEMARSSLTPFLDFGDNADGGMPQTLPRDVWLSDFSLGESGAGTPGNLHLIVTDYEVDVGADDDLILKVFFEKASWSFAETGAVQLQNLAGHIALVCQFEVAPVGPLRILVLDVPNSVAELHLDSASEAAVQSLCNNGVFAALFLTLYGEPLTKELLVELVEQGLAERIKSQGAPLPITSFTVTDSSRGSLDPPRFTSVEAHTVARPGDANSLAIMANLLADRQGVAAQYGSRLDGGQEFSAQISSVALHRLIVCSAVAKLLGQLKEGPLSPDQLPETCGENEDLKLVGDLRITHVDLRPLPDSQQLELLMKLRIKIDAYGVERIRLSQTARIGFRLEDKALVPVIEDTDTSVDVDLSTWGWVLRIGAAVITLGGSEWTADSLDDWAEGTVENLVSNQLGAVFKDLRIELLGGFEQVPLDYEQVAIRDDALELGGTMGEVAAEEIVEGVPMLVLEQEVTTLSDETTQIDLFVPTDDQKACDLVEDSYPILQHVAVREYRIFVADYRLLGRPIAWKWFLREEGTAESGSWMELEGEGTVMLPGDYPEVPSRTLDYAVAGDQLTLINDPADGNYLQTVLCQATDPTGTSQLAVRQVLIKSQWESGLEEYQEHVRKCMLSSRLSEVPHVLSKVTHALAVSEMSESIRQIREEYSPPEPLGCDPLPLTVLQKEPMEYLRGLKVLEVGSSRVFVLSNGATVCVHQSLPLTKAAVILKAARLIDQLETAKGG